LHVPVSIFYFFGPLTHLPVPTFASTSVIESIVKGFFRVREGLWEFEHSHSGVFLNSAAASQSLDIEFRLFQTDSSLEKYFGPGFFMSHFFILPQWRRCFRPEE
jgi:hypothetical protein